LLPHAAYHNTPGTSRTPCHRRPRAPRCHQFHLRFPLPVMMSVGSVSDPAIPIVLSSGQVVAVESFSWIGVLL
jgi:hypothetical protein